MVYVIPLVLSGVLDLLTACVFRIFRLAVIYPLDPTPTMLYLSFPLAWLIVIPIGGTRAILSCYRYKRGKD